MKIRNVNLDPWELISIDITIEHHTITKMVSLIICNESEYFYLYDEFEKIKDVSIMPAYIKDDWVNYNKKDLNIAVLNKHIQTSEKSLREQIEATPFKDDKEREMEETVQTLKALRRDLIIKGVI